MSTKQWFTVASREKVLFPRGVNDAWWIEHSSYGKESVFSEESPSPYLAANEWICGHLADFLRLGVPPFALFREGNGPRFFASLQFTRDKTPPPDTKPVKCWEKCAKQCTGILLFDVLIANDDRRSDQMAVDNPDDPSEITVFDHDQGLFGGMCYDAKKRVDRLRETDEIGIGRHCFADVIDSDQHFSDWYKRIASIPDWFIREICEDVRGHDGVRKTEVTAAIRFLIHRTQSLRDIVNAHRSYFPQVKWGTLL